MSIIFFGHGGSYNHGCEAIVRSTIEIIKPEEKPTLYTNSTKSDRDFCLDKIVELKEQRKPLNKYNPIHLSAMVLKRYFNTDSPYLNLFFKGMLEGEKNKIAISIGGDMYCYGKLPWLYYLHKKLKQNNNKTVLWGCSVDDDSFFAESTEDLRRYDLILARETISYELFKNNGIENVKLYPDPAFCLVPQEREPNFKFNGENTIAINISPLMDRYKGGASLENNVDNLINHILSTTDMDIVFVPHVNGDAYAEDDYTYLKKYADKYADTERVNILNRTYNCSELKYIISQCRFLITARTHASIAAYSTCIPTVVLGYSVKSRGIAKDIFGETENYVVPVQNLKTENELVNSFEWLVKNETKIKEHLKSFMPEYIEKSRSAKNEILAL